MKITAKTAETNNAKERKIIPPIYDFIFKQIFGTQKNADILADFLCAVLKLPKVPETGDESLSVWIQFFNTRKAEDLTMLTNASPMVSKAVAVLPELSYDEYTLLLPDRWVKSAMPVSQWTHILSAAKADSKELFVKTRIANAVDEPVIV